ncbi:MAG TPA: hypothetical protein VHO25_23700 [Polyangiaceae bacterium]|nr:hypothetical protein [Polyangiaceae bacterium]
MGLLGACCLMVGVLLVGCDSEGAYDLALPAGSAGVGGTSGGAGAQRGGSSGVSSGTGGNSTGSGSIGLTAGTAGSAGASGAAGGTATELPIESLGMWGMVGFGDPVAIDLQRQGDRLLGSGCYAGLPDPTTDPVTYNHDVDTCGPIVGEIIGQRLRFAIQFTAYPNVTDVVMSEDGTRMAGYFANDVEGLSQDPWLVSWLPIEQPPFISPPEPPVDRFPNAPESYGLILIPEESVGDEYSAERSYSFDAVGQGVIGELGAYWLGEWTWSEDHQHISIGPLPSTQPELPTLLQLDFANSTLKRVEATTANGFYAFNAILVFSHL